MSAPYYYHRFGLGYEGPWDLDAENDQQAVAYAKEAAGNDLLVVYAGDDRRILFERLALPDLSHSGTLPASPRARILTAKAKTHQYKVLWSDEDMAWVATCEWPSLSYLAESDPMEALKGLLEIVKDVDANSE